jgi:hypothetical protein
MSSLTLTDSQSAEILGQSQPIELRNSKGQLLAVALSAEDYKRYLYAASRDATSIEELNDAQAEYRARGGKTTEELYARIQQLGISGAGKT